MHWPRKDFADGESKLVGAYITLLSLSFYSAIIVKEKVQIMLPCFFTKIRTLDCQLSWIDSNN